VFAAILLLSVGGVVGIIHSDCGDDEVACACVCHDTVALHAEPSVLLPEGIAQMLPWEPRVHPCLLPPDIFRPPIA